MKFTVVSHAGLYVEHQGKSILFDPWLIGSCHWRSWWNYPEPDRALIDSLKPDAIYITHLHWDHFHSPSLRLFSRDTKIYVPKPPTQRMVDDLAHTGFTNVTEIPHGKKVQIGKHFHLYSYQFGVAVDSAAVVTDGKTTLLNANDCKIFGLPLKQITQRFPKIDFVFRSHSSASAIPYCIEHYHDHFSKFRTMEDYAKEFTNFALFVNARYAIPFASNHCFLHKETRPFNLTAANPGIVHQYFDAKAKELRLSNQCVVMPSGSVWDDQVGFNVRRFDYEQGADYVETLAKKYEVKLEKQYKREDRVRADFKAFEAYFSQFLNAVPRFLRKQMGPRIAFQIRDCEGAHHWFVDTLHKKILETEREETADFSIEMHAVVANDCTRKTMFSVWTASKRIRIRLATEKKLAPLTNFFGFLDLYETDVLPLRKNLSPRSLAVWMRRWRELIEGGKLLVKHKVIKKAFKPADLYPGPA